MILLNSFVQSAVADTIVTRPARDAIAIASDVAVLVAAASLAVLAVALLRLLIQWHGALKELRLTARSHFGPVSDRARSISDNVDFITQALRADVTRLNASVKALTDRLHQASDHMEERVAEFNALMEVVQEEAEDIFLDTAATVRGVRAGARTATGGRVSGPDAPDVLPPREDWDAAALEEPASPDTPESVDER